MSTISTDPTAALKAVHRATWAAGDYAAVARHIEATPAELLLPAAGVTAGARVLDVATGTGNAALRAAAAGAEVTGLDLTPELLDVAQDRAAAAGLDIAWVAGDAEALPFDDASFDRVLSVFGVQFAPRHEVVAAELMRVCRAGGAIGLVSWTPSGLIGRMLATLGRYLPAPPEFASPPPRWGDEAHVAGLFPDLVVERSLGMIRWEFAAAEAFQSFFEDHYGSMLKAQERLTADGTWDACRTELLELYRELDQGTDGLRMDAEFAISVIRLP